MDNTIQKWIIWSATKQGFFTRKRGACWAYSGLPDLAHLYSNFSDVQMAIFTLQKETPGLELVPVELKFHFNKKLLPGFIDE